MAWNDEMYLPVAPLNPQSLEYKFSDANVCWESGDEMDRRRAESAARNQPPPLPSGDQYEGAYYTKDDTGVYRELRFDPVTGQQVIYDPENKVQDPYKMNGVFKRDTSGNYVAVQTPAGTAPTAALPDMGGNPTAWALGRALGVNDPQSFAAGINDMGLVDITPPEFSGEDKASDTWAWITRAQWADYMDRFAPRENQLMAMSTYFNPEIATQQVDKAKVAAGTAFDTSQRMQQQYESRYGAGALGGERAYDQRVASVGKSAAIVDAANRITQKLIDQNREIAVGASEAANRGTVAT